MRLSDGRETWRVGGGLFLSGGHMVTSTSDGGYSQRECFARLGQRSRMRTFAEWPLVLDMILDMIDDEAGGHDKRAERPRAIYACQDYGKSARGVMLADVSQGDPGSR